MGDKNKELKKVCYYARVSTNSEDQRESFENQKTYFERELSKEKGFDLVSGYADRGLTATSFKNRVEFVQMLQDAGLKQVNITGKVGSIEAKYNQYTYVPNGKDPKFEYIYVKNSSRFARNIEVVSILRALKSVGVYVYFLDINKSSKNEADEMLLNFMFTMDERESRDRSEKVRFGAAESAKMGKIRVGKEIYGYNFNKMENTLRVIEEEAEIVKLIYKLREEGQGSRRIVNYLRENKIYTRRGVEWQANTVNRVLQNDIYTGRVVRNKYDCRTIGGNRRVLRDRSEWIIQETDRIDRIISDETFNKVQELIKKNTGSGQKKGQYSGRLEFATKLKCGNCGSSLIRNTNYYGKNKEKCRIFYNCATKKRQGVEYCNMRNIQSLELEDAIKNNFERYKDIVRNDFANIIDVLNKSSRTKIVKLDVNNSEEIERIKEEINQEKNKLKKIANKWIELPDGDKMIDVLKEMKDEINETIKTKEKEIESLQASKEEMDRKYNGIISYKNKINKYIKSIPKNLDRDVYIEEYLAKVIVTQDKFMFEHVHQETVKQLEKIFNIK